MVSPQLIARIESEEPTLRLAVLIDADIRAASGARPAGTP